MIVTLALDVLIASLLVATIVYCFLLNRKLEVLRAAQGDMQRLAEDFGRATVQARAGVAELKFAGEEAGRQLQAGIERARGLADELNFVTEAGGRLAERLEKGLDARRTAAPAPAAAGPARATARQDNSVTPLAAAAGAPARPTRRSGPSGRSAGEGGRTDAERELLQALRRVK